MDRWIFLDIKRSYDLVFSLKPMIINDKFKHNKACGLFKVILYNEFLLGCVFIATNWVEN